MSRFTRTSIAFLIGFILSAGAAALGLSLVGVKNQFGMKWDHIMDYRNDPTLSFNLYTSDVLSKPVTNWSLYTNISGALAWTGETDGTTNIGGTNYTLWVYGISNCPAAMAKQFFFATASNFYGESLPSNTVTSAPALMPIVTNSTRILRQ